MWCYCVSRTLITDLLGFMHRAMSGGVEGGAQQQKSGGFVAWYNSCLSARPLLTTSISTMIIASTGDVICQVRLPVQ